MFYLTIVNKTRRYCYSWLTGQYLKQIVFISQVISTDNMNKNFLGLIWSHVSETTILRPAIVFQFLHVNITVTDFSKTSSFYHFYMFRISFDILVLNIREYVAKYTPQDNLRTTKSKSYDAINFITTNRTISDVECSSNISLVNKCK